MSFTYYPGNGYSKETVSKTQALDVNGTEYNVLAYNINGNNYFKLRDIAKCCPVHRKPLIWNMTKRPIL